MYGKYLVVEVFYQQLLRGYVYSSEKWEHCRFVCPHMWHSNQVAVRLDSWIDTEVRSVIHFTHRGEHTNTHHRELIAKWCDHAVWQCDNTHTQPSRPIVYPSGVCGRCCCIPYAVLIWHPQTFQHFGPLKWHLLGHWFVDIDVIRVVMIWLHVLDRDFFAEGFSAQVSRRDKSLVKDIST